MEPNAVWLLSIFDSNAARPLPFFNPISYRPNSLRLYVSQQKQTSLHLPDEFCLRRVLICYAPKSVSKYTAHY